MESAIKMHEFYQKGYSEGYKQGFNDALSRYEESLKALEKPTSIEVKCAEFSMCPFKQKEAK